MPARADSNDAALPPRRVNPEAEADRGRGRSLGDAQTIQVLRVPVRVLAVHAIDLVARELERV